MWTSYSHVLPFPAFPHSARSCGFVTFNLFFPGWSDFSLFLSTENTFCKVMSQYDLAITPLEIRHSQPMTKISCSTSGAIQHTGWTRTYLSLLLSLSLCISLNVYVLFITHSHSHLKAFPPLMCFFPTEGDKKRGARKGEVHGLQPRESEFHGWMCRCKIGQEGQIGPSAHPSSGTDLIQQAEWVESTQWLNIV